MKHGAIFYVLVAIIFLNKIGAQDTAVPETLVDSKTPFSIGETISYNSKILNEERTLNIYLPNGYKENKSKKYPIIYLLDGSVDEDFIHIAGLVQFGSFSWINMVPESIVVGIANIDRERDFTYPTRNKEHKEKHPTIGGSEQFINFIEKEIQPLIESNYRTETSKTIIGQSLGGLLATEILFKKPKMFDNYVIVSPSLWYDDESLLEMKPRVIESNTSIYISVGKEGEVMERVAKSLYEKLKALDNKKVELYYNFFEKQNHGDALHLSVYDAFENIFKKKKD